MKANNTNTKNISKKNRPLGVWILTIYALVVAGIYPLYVEPLDLLLGYTAFHRKEDIPIIILWACLNLAIIIAGILTWKCSEIGRILFLVFVTIFFIEQGIAIFLWVRHISFFKETEYWLRCIADFVSPALYVWYFNKPSTKEFYRKSEQVVK